MINEWMGLAPNMSENGLLVDHMMGVVHAFMWFLFIGWSAFFLFVIWRFHRKRQPKANYSGSTSHFSTHAEIGVVIVEVILLLGFAFPLWAKQVSRTFPESENPLVVRAIGEQFFWSIHYPGDDGIFGKQNPDLVSATNPIGLDPEDPHAKDDIVSRNDMYVPVNRPVVVRVTSKDVIHNFGAYAMRVAQDAIPGSEIPMWFKPIKTGESEIICGQLCGSGHYSMRAFLYVVTEQEYNDWLASRKPKATAAL